jgi:predicted transcriptional regulator
MVHPVLAMANIFIVIDDDVERRLRLAVALRDGKKGDLSATIEEAIKDWLKKHSREIKRGLVRI